MFIKLLLLGQLLALCCAQLSLDEAKAAIDASVYSDEQTLDDVHPESSQQYVDQPKASPHYEPHHPPQHEPKLETTTTTAPTVPETTTLPQLMTENEATAAPEEGLQQLDDGLGEQNDASAVAVSTTTPEPEPETTIPTTTTPKLTTAKHEPRPHPYPHPYPYPHHPQSYPYAHGYPGLVFGPRPVHKDSAPKEGDKQTAEEPTAAHPAYPSYPGYPPFRPAYAPYQPPTFHRPGPYPSFGPGPSFGPAPGYGFRHEHPHKDDNEDSSDEKDSIGKDKDKSDEEAEDVALRPPGYGGYPQLYIVPRRPVVYPSPGRGYGSPYGGYGRF
ncbi:extensin [Drosophila guanche]|uniref:Uncharacterized protein n=1 Tax=Drosophila guanche TaxID=7266 RepID=A0A3B0KJM2_DROGU|nr:extensin [Drosophila guanche]SPP85956.1 Hypothetical predicted protein [Drosophila guanche]